MTRKQKTEKKSFLTTFWLATFLGIFGVDRYYLKQNTSSILKLLTLGGLGIWTLFDIIYTLSGKRKSAGKPLYDYKENSTSILAGFLLMLVISFLLRINHYGSLMKQYDDNQAAFIVASCLITGFVIGIYAFLGFTVVDAARRKPWGWACVSLIFGFFSLSIVNLYYYFFVRGHKTSTTVV